MNRKLPFFVLLAFAVLGLHGPARAVMIFEANLEGAQEVPPVTTSKSGAATLVLNDAMDRLEIDLQLLGFDLDGAQTADPSDDVLGLHIHAAPAGENGGIVFGLIGPDSDMNGDLVIDAVAGTVFSGWDSTEGNEGTTLTAQLPALLSGGLYLNVHTEAFPAGEVRGQILRVPEPGILGLLIPGSFMLLSASRRRST